MAVSPSGAQMLSVLAEHVESHGEATAFQLGYYAADQAGLLPTKAANGAGAQSDERDNSKPCFTVVVHVVLYLERNMK